MIKTPMWLKKVQTNISRGVYKMMDTFERDMMQIWANARIYNVDGSEIFELANELEALFQQIYREKLNELDSKSANASTAEGTPGAPQPPGPKLKLKLNTGAGRHTGRNGISSRAGTKKSYGASEDDDEEEEDARMSDSDD
jgi:hypothetical protein